jgi:hypothetical protein
LDFTINITPQKHVARAFFAFYKTFFAEPAKNEK